ncbi:hypothetical protein NDU88_001844, partial [Pleurodeles waltl]
DKICSVGKCLSFSNAVREEFHTRWYVLEAFENGGCDGFEWRTEQLHVSLLPCT